MAGSVASIGYVGLGVKDIPAWEHFAENVLGLQCLGADANGVSRLRMDDRWCRFALHPAEEEDLLYVGLEVADAVALASLKAQLASIGVEAVPGGDELARERRVVDLLRFEGPNGVAFEAFYGGTEQPEAPFRSARGSGFVTGDQGLGHVVMPAPDAPALLRFLQEGLGFRLSDIIERRHNGVAVPVYFLHCNNRHHSIALVQAPPGAKKLHHIMIQTKSLDDVGLAMDAARREGITLAATLGRHTNDHMVSFYVPTPSGFLIEYGWGAIEVGDAWAVRRFDEGSTWGHEGL